MSIYGSFQNGKDKPWSSLVEGDEQLARPNGTMSYMYCISFFDLS